MPGERYEVWVVDLEPWVLDPAAEIVEQFGIPLEMAETIVASRPTCVKRTHDATEAQAVLDAILRAGFVAQIRSDVSEVTSSALEPFVGAARTTPVPEPVGRFELVLPREGRLAHVLAWVDAYARAEIPAWIVIGSWLLLAFTLLALGIAIRRSSLLGVATPIGVARDALAWFACVKALDRGVRAFRGSRA